MPHSCDGFVIMRSLLFGLVACVFVAPAVLWQALREEQNEAAMAMAMSNLDDDSSVGTLNTVDTPTNGLDSARTSQHSARKSYGDVSDPENTVTPPASTSRRGVNGFASPKEGITIASMPTPPSTGFKDVRVYSVSTAAKFVFYSFLE